MITHEDITNEMLNHLLVFRLLQFPTKVGEVVKLIRLRLAGYTDEDRKDLLQAIESVQPSAGRLDTKTIEAVNGLILQIRNK